MKKLTFLLYNPNVFNGAGAMSRILSIMHALQPKYRIKVLILLSANRIFKLLLNSDFRNTYFRVLRLQDITFLPVFAPLFSLYKLDLMLIKFYDSFINIKNSIIQCETEIPSFYSKALKNKNNKIIFDKHGLIAEETELKWGKKNYFARKRLKQIKYIENLANKNSDLMICVSKVFKEVMVKKYDYHNEIRVLPMLINPRKFSFNLEARNSIRTKLGLNKKLVIAYSGSIAKYQKFESMVLFFKRLNSLDPKSTFLILSQPQFNKKIINILIRNNLSEASFIIKNLEFNQVSDYLSASDIGLLFRDDILLNNVSSPTKLLEYLAAGVYPIISPNIGDSIDLITDLSYGSVINDLNSDKIIAKIIKDYHSEKYRRRYVSLKVRSKYDWHSYLKNMDEIYAQ